MRIYRVAGMRKVVGVEGGKGRVKDPEELIEKARVIGKRNATILQVFDAEYIAGPIHLVHAVRQALLAMRTGEMRAQSPDLEILRWVAVEKEIRRAIAKVGVHESTRNFAFVCVGENAKSVRNSITTLLNEFGIKPTNTVLKLTRKKAELIKQKYGIKENRVEEKMIELIAGLALV